MNEGIRQNLNSEAHIKLEQDREDAEQLADYLARHPKSVISAENLREAGPEIMEFEAMIASFELNHSLEKLHAIVEISPDLATLFKYADDLEDSKRIEDAIKRYEKHNPAYVPVYKQKISDARAIVLEPGDREKFKLRRVAKKDIAQITTKLNTIKKETNISVEKFAELKEEYRRLAKALGSINAKDSNKVDHS